MSFPSGADCIGMVESMEPPTVVICQGPPRCMLQNEDAVKAIEAGCVWCRRITLHDDGSETETGPVEA